MSGNLEIIKRSYRAARRATGPGSCGISAKRGVWTDMVGGAARQIRGPGRGAGKCFCRRPDEWEQFACVPEEYFEDTGRNAVVMVGHYEGGSTGQATAGACG